MIVKLLTEHHFEFLSLKGGCRGSSASTLVKMSNCWKSHAAAQLCLYAYVINNKTSCPVVENTKNLLGKRILATIPGNTINQRGKNFRYPAKMVPALACDKFFAANALWTIT